MFAPSPDSPRRLSIESINPPSTNPPNRYKKRTRTTVEDSQSEAEPVASSSRHYKQKRTTPSEFSDSGPAASPVAKKDKKEDKGKSKTTNHTSKSNQKVSDYVPKATLQADSDGENAKVASAARKDDCEVTRLKAYYNPPFHKKGDDKTRPPLSYQCRFCPRNGDNSVMVSLSNLTGNIRVHRDGNTAAGQSDVNCPGCIRAQEEEPSLQVPKSVAKTRKALAKTGPMNAFVVATPHAPFSNLILNQMACAC